jgi:hypothetical protein
MSYDEASDAVTREANDIMASKWKIIGPEYLSNLVGVVRNGNLDDERKVLAVYLLGELRPSDTNSVMALLENIDLKSLKYDLRSMPRWGDYPAQEALISIGKPCVSVLLGSLPSEGRELRRHLICKTLVEIEGRNGESVSKELGRQIVQTQLGEKLATESDPSKKANLELALKEVEK